MTANKLCIFLSSPGDVGEERVLACRVLDRLQGAFSGRIKLERVVWEHEPLRATSHFQKQIKLPSETDIVVCILWSRLGTPLPEGFKREDGSLYLGGTEFEFEDAAKSYLQKGTPDLLVYRKTAKPTTEYDDEALVLQRIQQKKALDTFLDRWFGNPKDSFRAAFHTFESADQFEGKLEVHLHKLISERIPSVPVDEPMPIVWHKDSPYRGLKAFEFEHAPVFFGRTRAIVGIKEALVRQAAYSCAFVLVLGMSGGGKSSLVRAGVLPTLTQPGVIEGVGLWRWCVFRPSDSMADSCDGLASALFGKEVLPELAAEGAHPHELATQFKEAPQHALPLIRAGLHRVAEGTAAREGLAKLPQSRLALVVDQLEKLFREGVEAPQREAFIDVLAALARSGLVWVIATLRSDFYSRCAEIPELMALKEGMGQYDLLPPTAAEIGQMIRFPASAAGLRFEIKPETRGGLDDVLQTAARDSRALPLLEFALDELFHRRTEDRKLTFAAYDDLHGLEGSIAQKATEVFAGLDPGAQAALPSLLRELVTVTSGKNDLPTARHAPKSTIESSPERKRLLDAFIEARLLVSEKGDEGQAVVGIAHEALLNHWPRLREWVIENQEFLRARARVEIAAARWKQEGNSKDFLLPRGKLLEEAKEILGKPGAQLEQGVVDYIEASKQHATRERRKKRRIRASIISAFFIVISAFAIFTYFQGQETESLLVRTQVASGVRLMDEGDLFGALPWFTKALEGEKGRPEREEIHRMRVAEIWRRCPRPVQLWVDTAPVQYADFSPDGTRVITASEDRVKVWDALNGKLVSSYLGHKASYLGHKALVQHVAFSPDGRLVISAGEDQTAQVWDVDTGETKLTLKHGGVVRYAAFSSDNSRIVTASFDGTAQVWDVATGQPITYLGGVIHAVAPKSVWDKTVGVIVFQQPFRHKGWV